MPEQSPFDVLEASFRLLCTGPSPLAVDGREVGPPFPRRPIPLTELGGILLHPATSYDARDRAVRLLLDRARDRGDSWTVGLVGVLLPGLRAALAPMARAYPTHAADLEAEALTTLVAALGSFDPAVSGVAPRLIWRAAQRARRRVLREQVEAGPSRVRGGVAAEHHRESGHPDFVLARAVAAGVLSPADAELIARTRLEGLPLVAWARAAGERDGTGRMRRMRAERRLVEWLRKDACDESAFSASFEGAGRTPAVGRSGPGQLAQAVEPTTEVSIHALRSAPAAGATRPGVSERTRRTA